MESSINLGGQELQILDQMTELMNRGEHTLLLCKRASRISEVAQARNLPQLNVRFRNAIHIPSIFHIVLLIYRLKPKAIILHSGHDAICGSLSAKLVGLFFCRPKIIRARTYQQGIPDSFPYNFLFDTTFTPSNFLRNQILKNSKINPSKINVLYPGINFKQFEEPISDLSNELIPSSMNNSPWLFHAAMLRAEKGHEIILKSLPFILKYYPVKYIIAGEGPLKEYLQKLASDLNLDSHVFFLGSIEKIAPILKRSTIAIMPSTYEALGMFQIEALFNEIPVIASNVGGIPETIEHQKTGLLVEPGNTQAWEKSILWALDHQDQMRKFASIGKFTLEKFTIASNINQLLSSINNP